MKRPITTALCVVCLWTAGCAAWPGGNGAPERDSVARLAQLLTGAYNNHAQVWGAKQRGKAAPLPVRVEISAAGGGRALIFTLYEHVGSEDRLMRRARWELRPGKAAGTVVQSVAVRTAGEWRARPGCGVMWRRTPAGFHGSTRGAGCRFRAVKTGDVVVVNREFALTSGGLDYALSKTTAQGRPQQERRQLARLVPYTGWAGVRPREARGQGAWRVDDAVRVHNQGGSAKLADGFGRAFGYRIRLEQLVWPKSNLPMLRLSVIDAASGELIAYAWAAPDAERIGLNLGWFQAGLQKAD